MRIKKVKWKNHPVLGNLELDFTNTTTGKPFNTILLAGENGTGKTTILETLGTFLNLGTFEPFEYIEYMISSDVYKAVPTTHEHKNFFEVIDANGTTKIYNTDRNNSFDRIDQDTLDIRHYGCVFSRARADFKTKKITSTTIKQLDLEKYDQDEEDDFTALKQLIVDVQNQDNSDYSEGNQALGANPKSWDVFYPNSKIFRFKNAFDNFFDKLKYNKVVDDSSEKAITFIKNGRTISIDKLSTGEKQIVFRGIYLLKNTNKLAEASILIDEPELSMHPKWQQNILQYYKGLFTKASVQHAQLFFATHSEYVLERALSDQTENLVIVLTESGGSIASKRIDAPSVLPTITAAETNYLAFDIISSDYHIQLYGYLQTKESKNTVKACDDFIKGHALYNGSCHDKTSSHGTTTYQTLSTYIRNAINHPSTTSSYTEAELKTSIELLIQLCR